MRPATAGRAVSQQLESDYQMSQERERSRSRSRSLSHGEQYRALLLRYGPQPGDRVQWIAQELADLLARQAHEVLELHRQHRRQQLALLRTLNEECRQDRRRREQQAAQRAAQQQPQPYPQPPSQSPPSQPDRQPQTPNFPPESHGRGCGPSPPPPPICLTDDTVA